MDCFIMWVVDVDDWVVVVKGFLDYVVLVCFEGVYDVVFFVGWWCGGQLEWVW